MSNKKFLSSYAWKEGDLIDAKWTDGYYYPGKIQKVNQDDTLVVLFDDGDLSHRQRRDEVRPRKSQDESSSDSEIIIIPVQKKSEKPEGLKEKSTTKKPQAKKEKKLTTPKKYKPRKNAKVCTDYEYVIIMFYYNNNIYNYNIYNYHLYFRTLSGKNETLSKHYRWIE